MKERMFPLPSRELALLQARLSTLPADLRDLLNVAEHALMHAQLDRASKAISHLEVCIPQQIDTLRLAGMLQVRLGNPRKAFALFESALACDPHDVLVYDEYARARLSVDDHEGALALRRKACASNPDSAFAWFGMGDQYARDGNTHAAIDPLEQSIRLSPNCAPAHLSLGNMHISCGNIDEGASEYRAALRCDPTYGAAWCCLANIKVLKFTNEDETQMRGLLARPGLPEEDRIPACFALAKHYEDTGRYREAYGLLQEANESQRRLLPWNAGRFSAHVKHILAAFNEPHARAVDAQLGREVIFIVGLPRSGSTLLEQILASHSDVEGAGELNDLTRVLSEASAQRRQQFPAWVSSASPEVWQSLGLRYLGLTSRWRAKRPRFTDKMPTNWLGIGAIVSMLPAANVVICHRDPVETCWSCFKQMFTSNGSEFSYDLRDTATFWRDFDSASKYWIAKHPERVRIQSYEALVADPTAQIRDLLEFCDLSFEERCVRFHESSRPVRTTSAAQVRQPLQEDTMRASKYGSLLDPLRHWLEIDH